VVTDRDPRTAARLAVDAVDHFSKLLRSEVAVARAEFVQKLGEAVTGAASLVVAGVLLIPVIVVALFALAALLMELGLRASVAYGAAALGGLLLAGALALFGKSKLSPSNLALSHTAAELARDADAAKRT
jgi:hypothetical protein